MQERIYHEYFLEKDERLRFLKQPQLLSQEIEALSKKNAIIVIDEIQKVPELLDEVHRAIESNLTPRFMLTGSSARKLKRQHANMLGGRAVTYNLFPLSYYELEQKNNFNLSDFLLFGGLPKVYLTEDKIQKKIY